MAREEGTPPPGRRMGKYLLRRELGRGGMGIVYLAEDTQLGREVAIKTLHPGMNLGDRFLDRFRREARAVAALSHPNIVHINAFDVIDGCLVIEMPFLTGGSLYDCLREGLPLMRLTRILVELLRALACCHAAGIVHRDVKPGNVLFDSAGTAKLSDFGAAALVRGSWEESQATGATTTMFVGTPQYACPEAWSNETPAPHWDLFALGMMVREALTGAPAVEAASPLEYIEKIIRHPPPPLAGMDLPVSPGFAALIDACTEREPALRPKSAADALHTLELLPEYEHWRGLGQDTIAGPLLFGATRGAYPTRGPALRARQRKRLAVAAGVAFGAILLIVAAVALLLALLPRATDAPAAAAVATPPPATAASPLGSANPWHSGVEAGRDGWVLIRRDDARGTLEGIGVLGRQLLRFSGTATSDGRVNLSGVWGSVSDAAGTAPRYGRVSGHKQPGVAGHTLDLEFISETDLAHWRESVHVIDTPHASSPEDLVHALESSQMWSRLLFGEVLARDIEDQFRFAPFLFAAPGARLRAAHERPALGAALDGLPDEAIWAEAGLDRQGRRPSMAAVMAPGGIGLALSAPGAPRAPRLRLALAPAHDLDDTRWRGIEIAGTDLRAPEGAAGAFSQSENRIDAELWLPAAPAQDSAWPHRDTAFRLNAVLVDGDGEDAVELARWGAADMNALGEGVLVYLNPARTETP